METFNNMINVVSSVVWSIPLVVLCLIAGLVFSIWLGFPQIRHFILRVWTACISSRPRAV